MSGVIRGLIQNAAVSQGKKYLEGEMLILDLTIGGGAGFYLGISGEGSSMCKGPEPL